MDNNRTPDEEQRVNALKAIAAMWGYAPQEPMEAVKLTYHYLHSSRDKDKAGDIIGGAMDICIAALIAVANDIPDSELPAMYDVIKDNPRSSVVEAFSSRDALIVAAMSISTDLLLQDRYDLAEIKIRQGIADDTNFRDSIVTGIAGLTKIITSTISNSDVLKTTAIVVAESLVELQEQYHDYRQQELVRLQGDNGSKESVEQADEMRDYVKKWLKEPDPTHVIAAVYADIILSANVGIISPSYILEAEKIMRSLEVVAEASGKPFHFFRVTIPQGTELKPASKDEIANVSIKHLPAMWKRSSA